MRLSIRRLLHHPARPLSIALALGVLSAGLAAQTVPLQLVSTPWSPFTNAAGQARFALDLVETALTRIGITSTTTIVEPGQFTTALLSGPYDGSGAAWRDPERDLVLLFSQPYLENRLVLVARRGGDVSATTLSALKGKRIALVEGYSYGEAVDNAGPTYVRSKSEEDSLSRLLKSEVDYTLMDELVVQYIVNNYATEAQTRLQLGKTPLIKRSLFFAVNRKVPNYPVIVDRFNTQLRSMMADGTYHRLLHVDWIYADVDGDGVSEYVPQGNSLGSTAPKNAYTITTPEQPAPNPDKPLERFFIGGAVYKDWNAVPDRYKVTSPSRPNPASQTATIFTFTW